MRYLAYGSNLHPTRLGERVPSATLLGNVLLQNRVLKFHKRSVIDGSAKCNMYPATGAIHGAVYEIADKEKPDLDRAEGLGQGYRIEKLDLTGFGECFSYVATDSHIDEWLKPYSWYKELVLIGCEYLRFPSDYIAAISSIACIEDLNRQRHDRHMQIVSRARNARRIAKQE